MIKHFLKPADELALMLDWAAIPYKREVKFHKTRRWRFDFAFSGKIALEVDGGVYARKGAKKCWACGHIATGRHTTGAGFEKDCEKLNAAVLGGWRVLRVTPKMIADGSAVMLIKAAL